MPDICSYAVALQREISPAVLQLLSHYSAIPSSHTPYQADLLTSSFLFTSAHHTHTLPPALSQSISLHALHPPPTPRLALRVCHMGTHTVNRSPRRVCSWMQSSFQKVHTKAYTNPSTRTGRRTSVAQGSSWGSRCG